MARTKKVTITLPAELLEGMKAHTDHVSAYLTERAERRRRLREELDLFQEESGAFTNEEMVGARELLHGIERTERVA